MTFATFALLYLLPFAVLLWGMVLGWMLRGFWDNKP